MQFFPTYQHEKIDIKLHKLKTGVSSWKYMFDMTMYLKHVCVVVLTKALSKPLSEPYGHRRYLVGLIILEAVT